MPVIIFEGPRLTREQKEQLVNEFASAAARITNLSPDKIITLIKENSPEDVGVGTQLLADTRRG